MLLCVQGRCWIKRGWRLALSHPVTLTFFCFSFPAFAQRAIVGCRRKQQVCWFSNDIYIFNADLHPYNLKLWLGLSEIKTSKGKFNEEQDQLRLTVSVYSSSVSPVPLLQLSLNKDHATQWCPPFLRMQPLWCVNAKKGERNQRGLLDLWRCIRMETKKPDCGYIKARGHFKCPGCLFMTEAEKWTLWEVVFDRCENLKSQSYTVKGKKKSMLKCLLPFCLLKAGSQEQVGPTL